MKLFEINDTDAEVDETPFANFAQTKELAKTLEGMFPDTRFVATNKSALKPVPHIRIFGLSRGELLNAMTKLGAEQQDLTQEQTRLSTKYAANIFSFKFHDTINSFVISSKGTDDTITGVGIKEYSPTNLGLAGKVFNKSELIDAAKKAVSSKAKDESLKNALLGLIDIAAAGAKGKLSPELNSAIAQDRNQLSVDFGEVLAPIAIMTDQDQAEFPVGNSPLVDVKVGNQNISVKSLSGSGTSFRSIADLMDKYENAMTEDDPKKIKFNILKQFHPNSPGKNVDKIIAASETAGTAENLELKKILGVPKLTSFAELTTALSKLKGADYPTFLKTMYPVMTAGDWGKPVGLPADGAFYMGQKKEAPKKEKAAGKRSYDSDPTVGGANILTYVLGVGLLNFITRGGEAEEYSNMMTDIVKESEAVLGKIDITVDGGLKITTKPFNTLKFNFQYHAPSHIPGNNLPGFAIIHD